jgi:hypothetical protein
MPQMLAATALSTAVRAAVISWRVESGKVSQSRGQTATESRPYLSRGRVSAARSMLPTLGGHVEVWSAPMGRLPKKC